MHPASLSMEDLLRDCEVTRTRRSGPGGQNRNKVETAIVLRHRPTGLSAEASERRSQEQNRSAAAFRLRLQLAVEIRSEAGPAASALWTSRRRGQQIHVNEAHEDFPTLLAEALDHLAAADHDVRAAGERLAVSPTQLVNLLKQHAPAFAALNAARAARGLSPLR